MRKKRKLLICCFMIALLSSSFFVYAQEPVTVVLDGKLLSFDVQPQIINGRTMVPMKIIFEALGADVQWEGVSKTVTSTKDDIIVKAVIGEKSINVNGEKTAIDVAPIIIGGRTLVPAKFISEAFGCSVDWDGSTRTVYIYTQQNNTSLPYSNPDDKDSSDDNVYEERDESAYI